MKIWFKIIKENHLLNETVIENASDISRTKKIFSALEEACHLWDLAVPIWLDTTVRDFQRHSRARFTPDCFTEAVDFDYMEIRVIEE